jgi:hypothetical protein
MSYLITTTKGKHQSDSLTEVVRWQRQMQGALANITRTETGVDVSIQDMDIGDVTQAVQEITRRLDEEELHQDFEDWMLEQDTGKEYEEDLLP